MMNIIGSLIVCCSVVNIVASEKWSWPEDTADNDQVKQSSETESRSISYGYALGDGDKGIMRGGYYSDGSQTNGGQPFELLETSLTEPQGTTGIGPAGFERNYEQYAQGSYNYNKHILSGPEGATGTIGPKFNQNLLSGFNNARGRPILSGPEGPTGIIGPNFNQNVFSGFSNVGDRPILSGPGGPTGIIGPNKQRINKGLLVGPGGPTGLIGPKNVLTGPHGPTGIIGPNRSFGLVLGDYGSLLNGNKNFNNRQVLVGPRGPSGIIGPFGFRN